MQTLWQRFTTALSIICLVACSHQPTNQCAADIKQPKKRSASAKASFIKANPCPSTGKTKSPCPGYIVDHIVPIKRQGADHPINMQWQTVEEAKAKDKWE